jgi:N-glycosylase/DNA lyase
MIRDGRMMSSSEAEDLRNDLIEEYSNLKEEIRERMEDFNRIWETRDSYSVLRELFFCILTPQSKATTCWGAVEDLTCNDLLFQGSYEEVLGIIGVVRFKYRKASYILEAREKFIRDGENTIIGILEGLGSPLEMREWLVREIKGYGYKEASHFLRNIGLGSDLAILDRHILKNLKKAGTIEEIPTSMTERRYKEIEGSMKVLSKELRIPLAHLDLLLWYREAGSIFK